MSPDEMSSWWNVFMMKCLHDEMSRDEMSHDEMSWEHVWKIQIELKQLEVNFPQHTLPRDISIHYMYILRKRV